MSGSGEWSGIETVAESGGRFFDPPRLFPDRMGNLGLVYPNLAEDRFGLFFQYRPVGGVWSEAVRIDSGNASATQPSIVFDTQGKAHVVWQEGDAWFSDIFYTTIDPQTMTVSSGKRLNSGEFSARQPVIALDSMTNRLSVAWIETGEDGGKSIHLRNEITTPVRNWSLF